MNGDPADSHYTSLCNPFKLRAIIHSYHNHCLYSCSISIINKFKNVGLSTKFTSKNSENVFISNAYYHLAHVAQFIIFQFLEILQKR